MKSTPERPRSRDPWDTGRARAWIQWYAPNTAVDEVNSPSGELGPKVGSPEQVMIRVIYGRDMTAGDQLRNESTDEIICRYRPDVAAGWAAVDLSNGCIYRIIFPNNVEQKCKTLVCWAKKRIA